MEQLYTKPYNGMNYSFVLKILSLDKYPLIFLQPLYDFNIRQELKHTLQTIIFQDFMFLPIFNAELCRIFL